MAYAILFPGQGIQHIGMGADLFEKHPDLLGTVADEILGWSLRDVCLNGPEEELLRTDHLQPALYALSYVLWEELEPLVVEPPAAAAGHSLGEYTALAAALDSIELAPPKFPVWANLTAAPVHDFGTALLQQVVAPVRFTQTLAGMGQAGIRMFLHIGPGNVTATMAKRTVRDSEVHHFSHVADVDEAAERIGSLIQ